MRLLSLIAGLAVLGLFPLGCHSGNDCRQGSLCSCSGGNECYLGCDGDGCAQSCGGLDRCGTVCNNGCSSTCSNTSECSQSCGNDCVLSCSSTPTCGIICGAGCTVDCTNASVCGVRVGAGSQVNCQSVGQCTVECLGPCTVAHGSNTSVSCLGGEAMTDCGGGRTACGAC